MRKNLVKRCLPVLAMIGLAVYPRPGVPASGEGDSCHEGRFSNETYLYSIDVPEGTRCCHDPAPSPVHGCALSLHGTKKTNVWVDGSYNTMDFESVEDALSVFVGRYLVAGTTLTVLRHEPARLGSFEAVRLTLRIARQGEEAAIEDRVMALATREGRGEIIYTVGLKGPEGDYPRDKALLERIVGSWRETKQ